MNKFQTLYELAVSMTSVRNLDQTISLVAGTGRELLKTDVAVVALRDEGADELYMHTLLGLSEERFRGVRIPVGEGLGGRIAATGRGLVIQENEASVEEIRPEHQGMLRQEGLVCGMGAPIQMGKTNLGVIYVGNRDRTDFSQSDLETLTLMGNLLAVQIARGRAEHRLREAHEKLESRVESRTAELVKTNEDLKREIKERKRAEHALRASESKYRFLAENAQDILWTVDMSLTTTFVSLSVQRILGFTPEERLSQPIHEQLTVESLDRAVKTLQHELVRDGEEGVDPNRTLTMTLDFINKEGLPVCLETVMSFVRDEHGNPVGVYGLSRDVTERMRAEQAVRESEKRLAEIIDFLPDATFVIDSKGTVVAWNRAIERMTGIPGEEMIGKGNYEYAIPFYGKRRPTLIDLVNNRDLELETQDLSILDKGETMVSESYHPHLGPEPLYLWGTARRLYDSQGTQVGAIESIRDITSRKKTEEAFKDAKEAAESATRARSEFLANMSHEIRTPLNAVQGMIDLLLDSELTNVQRGRIEIIKSAADSLLALLNDILDFSKIDAGRLDLEEINFDFRASLSSAVSLLQMRAQEKGLDIRYTVSDMVPEYLRGDPNRITQVMLNLANNAIKFTHEGSVEIRVEVLATSGTEVVVHCAVSDTGIGIPTEKLPSIFDRFSQADSSTTRKYGGSGLGLAIAAQIVRMMGGTIWVMSERGKGSTFHFTARLGLGEYIAESDVRITQEMAALIDLSGMKVLLVEDNLFNQAVAVELLKKLRCEVIVASNGMEAVRVFEREPLDVILMDLQMPEMDGFEATSLIRSRETVDRIPIIAQTAQAFEEDRERCFAVGMDEHIPKPIKAAELLRILQKYALLQKQSVNAGDTQVHETPADSRDTPIRECFDLQDLLYRLEGDEEAVSEMVSIFMEVTPQHVRQARDAAAKRDWDSVSRLAHSLKGACASFGACALHDVTVEMEQAAKARDPERVDLLAEQMDQEFHALVQTLDRLGLKW